MGLLARRLGCDMQVKTEDVQLHFGAHTRLASVQRVKASACSSLLFICARQAADRGRGRSAIQNHRI